MVVFQNCVLVRISISEIRISEIRVIQGIGHAVVKNYLIICNSCLQTHMWVSLVGFLLSTEQS